MKIYFVNKNSQENGDYEVHIPNCKTFPKNAEDLGQFPRCEDAIKEAKRRGYLKADGCKFCIPNCHKR